MLWQRVVYGVHMEGWCLLASMKRFAGIGGQVVNPNILKQKFGRLCTCMQGFVPVTLEFQALMVRHGAEAGQDWSW